MSSTTGSNERDELRDLSDGLPSELYDDLYGMCCVMGDTRAESERRLQEVLKMVQDVRQKAEQRGRIAELENIGVWKTETSYEAIVWEGTKPVMIKERLAELNSKQETGDEGLSQSNTNDNARRMI